MIKFLYTLVGSLIYVNLLYIVLLFGQYIGVKFPTILIVIFICVTAMTGIFRGDKLYKRSLSKKS
jgi:hypothetical protein